MSIVAKGKHPSTETKIKLQIAMKKRWQDNEYKNTVLNSLPRKQKHWNWKGGIKNRDRHSLYNLSYVAWRNAVFLRDNFKCRIASDGCKGQIQAHHILPWRDFIDERYNINNGITLCHAHHPRKVAEEKRLEPIFQALVAESKALPFHYQEHS